MNAKKNGGFKAFFNELPQEYDFTDPKCSPDKAHLFFCNEHGFSTPKEELAREAIALCQECPFYSSDLSENYCLKFALKNNEKTGIWGGTTPRQRKVIKSQLTALAIKNSGKK